MPDFGHAFFAARTSFLWVWFSLGVVVSGEALFRGGVIPPGDQVPCGFAELFRVVPFLFKSQQSSFELAGLPAILSEFWPTA